MLRSKRNPPDHAFIVEASFAEAQRLAQFAAALFNLQEGCWQRSDVTLVQRCYSKAEVEWALTAAGFGGVSSYDAEGDLCIAGSAGRTFLLAQKG